MKNFRRIYLSQAFSTIDWSKRGNVLKTARKLNRNITSGYSFLIFNISFRVNLLSQDFGPSNDSTFCLNCSSS